MVERVVYVLGAGASHDAGGPLVKDFFSRETERSKTVHTNYFDGDSKFSALESIYADWSSRTKNPNIESFFKRVEFQTLIGKPFENPLTGERTRPEVFYQYLVWYIAAYVRNSIAYQRQAPKCYRDFAASLKTRGKKQSILTFNYDLVFEKAIIDELGGIDYRLGRLRQHPDYCRGIPLLKLHGSLNWQWCPKCDNIYIFDEPVGHRYNRVSCTSRCGGLRERLVVPPNPNKQAYLETIYGLWSKADRLLSEADRVVIIGYSVPEIDISAQELLKNAAIAAEDIHIEIVNPDLGAIGDIASRLGLRRLDTGGHLNYAPVPLDFKKYVEQMLT